MDYLVAVPWSLARARRGATDEEHAAEQQQLDPLPMSKWPSREQRRWRCRLSNDDLILLWKAGADKFQRTAAQTAFDYISWCDAVWRFDPTQAPATCQTNFELAPCATSRLRSQSDWHTLDARPGQEAVYQERVCSGLGGAHPRAGLGCRSGTSLWQGPALQNA